MVGFDEVLQHTPLAVTDVIPSLVTLPPQVAVVQVTLLTGTVVTVGVGTNVVNWSCVPYTVPELLVA